VYRKQAVVMRMIFQVVEYQQNVIRHSCWSRSLSMEEDRIWILFGRRVSGEITPEELKELKALMRERPDEGYSMEIILGFLESERKADEQADAERAARLWPRLEVVMHAPEVTYSNPPLTDPAKTLRSE
jgi:hypothetical protein